MNSNGHTRCGDGGRRGAFSLGELLVVLAIVSSLLGVPVPVVGKARAHPCRGDCRGQLHIARKDNQGLLSSVERMNLVLQHVDPQTPAKMRKHVPAVVARMEERGIQGVSSW